MPRFLNIFILLVLLAIIIIPRTLDLNAFTTADENRWLANTAGFITNLAHGDWGFLMQQPHPGITTQWLAAPTVFAHSWALHKLPLVLAQSIMVLITGYLLLRLTDKKTALLATFLLSINPLLIAHTRVYAMDSLLSHFLILSLLSLLLWQKTTSTRYLVFSGCTAAAAILSKLPGVIIIPFTILLFLYLAIISPPANRRRLLKAIVIWSIALMACAVLILPSLIFNPILVTKDILTWFQSDDYHLHHIGPTYYLRTLSFFSTPLHIMALFIAPLLLWKKLLNPTHRRLVIIFLLFALLFTLQMSLGAKKGDRYILPVFLCLDIVTAVFIAWLSSQDYRRPSVKIAGLSIIGLIFLQLLNLHSLHPHELAYVNPITRPFFGQRRLGWGEGLDLAAQFLNRLPNASQLTVASYYPKEFQDNFKGHTVPAHQHDQASVDYVVIYRAMFNRGPDAWETDVIRAYQLATPIYTVSIAGTPMAWIYKK